MASNRKRRSSEAFTAQGVWWVPDAESGQVAGDFIWDPGESGRLELIGSFSIQTGTLDSWRSAVVHGVADRDSFTLLDCVQSSFNISMPGVATQQVREFGGVLAGMHLSDPEAAVFDRVVVELDYLAELTGRSGVSTSLESADGQRVDRVVLEYEQPPDTVAVLPDETVRLSTQWRMGGAGSPGRTELEESTVLVVDTQQPLAVREIVSRYVPRLRDLVTFAAQRPATVRSVRLAGPGTAESRDDLAVKRTVAFLAPFLPTPKEGKGPSRADSPLVVLPVDDRSFRVLMRSWFELADRLGPVLDLHLAAGYASFIYGESRFLNAVQAVEALHRRLLAGEPDKADIEARAAALQACPTEYRKWLEGRLRFAHEPNLRRRLREVLDYVGPGVKPLVNRRSAFIDRVVRVRNELTHWDVETKTGTSERLYYFSQALGVIVDAAILRYLGYSTDEVAEALGSNDRFRLAVERLAP